jgi:hypothetical protein
MRSHAIHSRWRGCGRSLVEKSYENHRFQLASPRLARRFGFRSQRCRLRPRRLSCGMRHHAWGGGHGPSCGASCLRRSGRAASLWRPPGRSRLPLKLRPRLATRVKRVVWVDRQAVLAYVGTITAGVDRPLSVVAIAAQRAERTKPEGGPVALMRRMMIGNRRGAMRPASRHRAQSGSRRSCVWPGCASFEVSTNSSKGAFAQGRDFARSCGEGLRQIGGLRQVGLRPRSILQLRDGADRGVRNVLKRRHQLFTRDAFALQHQKFWNFARHKDDPTQHRMMKDHRAGIGQIVSLRAVLAVLWLLV